MLYFEYLADYFSSVPSTHLTMPTNRKEYQVGVTAVLIKLERFHLDQKHHGYQDKVANGCKELKENQANTH